MTRIFSCMAAAVVPLVVVATASTAPGIIEEMFKDFMQANNRSYASAKERLARSEVFATNLVHIQHFQIVEESGATYSHLTPFADLSLEEFSARHGFRASDWDTSADVSQELLDVSALPDGFDWRKKGAVNLVKNQAQCGSCWAFATIANIEGAGFVTTQKLVSLSEQELVDCDKADEGCSGGLPSNAYKDMIQNNIGLEPEQAYPYSARNGQCQAAKSKEVAFISGWKAISTDEDQIAAALMQYGPLAIGINAGPMQFYFGGVANPWKILCNPKSLDHGVAIVGFGTEGSKKYWIIRNSWGASWGEKGYYRIIRGTGACGLNTMVTTATGIKIQSLDSSLVV
mmetsp:Transcript_82759/g.268018  ORF Transcript_82759/g.268018 Transcript_82759/m.268018 type:complete len:343 (+) Transcript_82759:69-1097(+)